MRPQSVISIRWNKRCVLHRCSARVYNPASDTGHSPVQVLFFPGYVSASEWSNVAGSLSILYVVDRTFGGHSFYDNFCDDCWLCTGFHSDISCNCAVLDDVTKIGLGFLVLVMLHRWCSLVDIVVSVSPWNCLTWVKHATKYALQLYVSVSKNISLTDKTTKVYTCFFSDACMKHTAQCLTSCLQYVFIVIHIVKTQPITNGGQRWRM